MISISILYIVVVMFSRLGKASLAFDNQQNDHDYVMRTNGQSNVENFVNVSEGEKIPLMMLIPVKDTEKTEIDETEKFNKEDHRRHTRCKYSRIPKKSRRTTSEEDPDTYLFVLKSTSGGIARKPDKKQQGRKAVQRATHLRDLSRNSRTTNRKNSDSIRQRGILQPRPQDTVMPIGKESVASTNEISKKYVCSCTKEDDETEKLPKKSVTSNISPKNKKWPDALGQNEYGNNEVHEKSSKIGKSKGTVGDSQSKESLSATIATDEPIRSKELSQLTDKIVQPMRIAIPLIGEHGKDSVYSQVNNKWPFFRILRKDYRSNDQASFEVVEPYSINPNVLHRTASATSFRPAYVDNFPGTRGYSPKETASKLFSGRKDPLHDTFASTSGQNFPKMDEWMNGSHEREENDHAPSSLPFFNADEPMRGYKSFEKNGGDVDALQNALEYQLDGVHDQQPITSFQYIPRGQPTRLVGNEQESHSTSTEYNNVAILKRQQAAKEYSDQYRHVEPSMSRSDSNDRLAGYSEATRESEENETSRKVSKEYLSKYPPLWAVEKSQNHHKSMSNRYQMIAKPIKDDFPGADILETNNARRVTDGILGQSQPEVPRIKESGNNLENVTSSMPLIREPELPLMSGTLDEFCSRHEGATSNEILREYIESLFRNARINVQQAKSPLVQKVPNANPSTDAGFHVDKSDVWDSLGDIITPPESSRRDSDNRLSSNEVSKNPIGTSLNISVNKVPFDPPRESILENRRMEEKSVFVGDMERDRKTENPMMTRTEKNGQISSPTTKIWTMNVNGSGSTDKTIDATPVIHPDANIHAESNTEYQYVEHVAGLSDVSAAGTRKSSLAYQSQTENAADEKTPIKYYSPTDRILAYKKKSQALNVTPQLKEQMTTAFQSASSRENPLSPASLKSKDFPSATEDSLKLFQSLEFFGKDATTYSSDESEIPTSNPDNDDDNTVPSDLMDGNHDSDKNAFSHKKQPWKIEEHLEHNQVVESSPMFDVENFSHVDATDHYIVDPLEGSENRASAESTKFRNMLNPIYKRSDFQTTEESNQEDASLTTELSDEKNTQDARGIVNFGDVRSEISTTGYKETAKHTSQPQITKTEEKATFIERIRKLSEVSKNAPMQRKSAIPIRAAKNLHNHPRWQKNPNERVSSYRDENINYGALLGSVDQSNHATPPYDPTYFGMLTFDPVDPVEENISDLTSANLFYIGDGVKIPMKITKMSDRSWGLAMSEEICKNFVERECPCCVASGVNVVEKKKRSNEESTLGYKVELTTGKNHIFLSQTENSVSTDEPNGRYTRSSLGGNVAPTSTTPAVQFAKKDNLTPELTEFPNDSVGSSAKVVINRLKNIGQRDRVESSINQPMTKSSGNIDRIMSGDGSEDAARIFNDYDMDEVPKRSNFAKSGDRIYHMNSDESVQNHLPVEDPSNLPQNTKKTIQNIDELDGENLERDKIRLGNDDDLMANELAKYGYQRNNPILQRIKFIGEKQMEQAPYRYQRNIDHDAREKIDAVTTLLHWLKNVFLESASNNDS